VRLLSWGPLGHGPESVQDFITAHSRPPPAPQWSRILDAQPEFKRAAVYKVAVSWSENWGLYVYQRM
jgi:hypothetical protein